MPRDSDGNITKWVEGMRTCRCGINGGKHLFKECPVGGKPPSEQKANMVPHETAAPPPATTKSDDAVTPAAISEQLADGLGLAVHHLRTGGRKYESRK